LRRLLRCAMPAALRWLHHAWWFVVLGCGLLRKRLSEDVVPCAVVGVAMRAAASCVAFAAGNTGGALGQGSW
jgi:hypothetical protein